jgi:hypothetical protein
VRVGVPNREDFKFVPGTEGRRLQAERHEKH